MTQAEFMIQIRRCVEKAFLDTSWGITSDEDEVADLCVDRSGSILLQDKNTGYNVAHVTKIKYGINGRKENHYILISFRDGTDLRFGNRKDKKCGELFSMEDIECDSTKAQMVLMPEKYSCFSLQYLSNTNR